MNLRGDYGVYKNNNNKKGPNRKTKSIRQKKARKATGNKGAAHPNLQNPNYTPGISAVESRFACLRIVCRKLNKRQVGPTQVQLVGGGDLQCMHLVMTQLRIAILHVEHFNTIYTNQQ